MVNIIEVISEGEILEEQKITEVKLLEEDCSFRKDNFGRGRSRSKERQYSANYRRNNRNSSRSRSGSRVNINRERIRCFKCRTYDQLLKIAQMCQRQIRSRQSRCNRCLT